MGNVWWKKTYANEGDIAEGGRGHCWKRGYALISSLEIDGSLVW